MSKNPKVNEYMEKLDNPQKAVWEEIRTIVLGVDPKIEEDIKWGAPTFIYKGNLATFNPRAKKFVNLTFLPRQCHPFFPTRISMAMISTIDVEECVAALRVQVSKSVQWWRDLHPAKQGAQFISEKLKEGIT